MSTCEQSIGAKNLFLKGIKLEEFDQGVLRNFAKSSFLRFQSCIDWKSTQLRNLEEKYCLGKQIKNKCLCEVFRV